MVDSSATSGQRLSLPQNRRQYSSKASPKLAASGSLKRDFLSPRDALIQLNISQLRQSQARSTSDSFANIKHDATPFHHARDQDLDSDSDSDPDPYTRASMTLELYPQRRSSSLAATAAASTPNLHASGRQHVNVFTRRTAASSSTSLPLGGRMQKPSMGRSKLDRVLGRRIDWQRLPTAILDCVLEQLRLSHVHKMSLSCITCYMRDLCALQVVCRWWELPAQKKLYSYIELLGDDDPIKLRKMRMKQGARLTLLRRTLRSRPFIASLVKGLHVADPSMSPYRSNESPNPDYDEYIGLLASLVMTCPNLERFDGFYPVYTHTYDRLTYALSTRTQLKQHVWVVADKTVVHSRPEKELESGLVQNHQVYEFLQYHRSWDQLQTLMLCSRVSFGFLDQKDVITMFECLPALKNLCLKSFKASEFNNDTLMKLPRLQMLRLEECSGVTDVGLSEWASSSGSIFIKKLCLIKQNVSKLQTLARILSQLIQLRRFTIVQGDRIPDVPAGASSTQPFLASETLQFLHWDIGPDASALRSYEEHEDLGLKELEGKDGLHPNALLAMSIGRGGFPLLTHLRAPQDVSPSGILQSVCRPARNGKTLLPGDNYATPRIDPTLNTNSLRAARIRAQGVIARHLQKRKAWMTIVITDHSHQEPYIPQPLSASSTGSSVSTTRTTSTDMTEVEEDTLPPSEQTDRHSTTQFTDMAEETPISTETGENKPEEGYPSSASATTTATTTTTTTAAAAMDQSVLRPRAQSPPPKKWNRHASTLLSPIKIPSRSQTESRNNEPLKVREHILPTFAGRISVHMDQEGRIFQPPIFHLLPDIHGHDENGGIVGWDDLIKVKDTPKAKSRTPSEAEEDRERSKDGCDGTWNKWQDKDDIDPYATRAVREMREQWRHWRRPRVKEGTTTGVEDFF